VLRIGSLQRLLLVCGLIALAGCGDDGGVTPPVSGSITLHLQEGVDDQGLIPYDIRYTNAAGNLYSVSKLAYYISDVRLRRSDGSEFVVDAVHYRNIDLPSTREFSLGDVPNGTYTTLLFTFGLNATRNVDNGLPESLWYDMAWPVVWGGGFHYMQMEGRYADTSGANSVGYATHTGRRKLSGDPAPYHYFFTVTLPLSLGGPFPLVVQGDRWSVDVIMNINEWYRGPNVYDLSAQRPDMMIDVEAQTALMENGANVFHTGPARGIGP